MQPSGDFTLFINDFERKLETVIIDDISPELYCRKYLSHLLLHKKYYLHIYADVLQKLVVHSGESASKITLVDYGAGNGLLGLFAAFCGFKKVYLSDIDEHFLEASRQLALKMNIFPAGFIAGGVESLQSYFVNEKPDAITGTDVIEHIYDLELFLSELQKINPGIVSVFTTASNPVNYLKVRELKKIQIKDELKGGNPGDHILFGESPLEPFLTIRKNIIRDQHKQISEDDIHKLAKATRGLNKEDIYRTIDKFCHTGEMPVPGDGANTCNPLNGSWTERILSLQTYNSYYRDAGFTCKIYAGFYNEYEKGLSAYVKKLLNSLIGIFGKRISPYIVIVGSGK